MANTTNLGLGTGLGRRMLDRFGDDLTARLKQTTSSRPFVLFAVAATVLIFVYYFVIAAPIYVSSTSFSIRGREQPTPALGLLAGLGGQPTNAGTETAEVSQYVTSWEMLSKLDQRFHLRDIYSKPRLDFRNHMSPGASNEDFLSFYQRMVKVRTDHETNIVTVEVRSFDAKSAQQIAEAVLEVSGEYVNSLSDTVRRDSLRSSEVELQKAEDAVRQARLNMTRYRTSSSMVDPVTNAAAASTNVNLLQQQIQGAEAELASLRTYTTENSPQVKQIQARIAALQGQIVASQKRISTGGRDPSLAQRLYDFEGLAVANEYAEKQLIAALSSYDSARTVASQRERFLVRVVSPHLPDRATLPHRMTAFLETLLVVLAAYGILALAVAGVRDHQGI